jgi:hypothetical protein
VTPGAAAACAARGADVAASRQRRREVVVVAVQLAHTREASDRAPFKRPLSLTGGPRIFLFIKIYKHPHFDIRICDLLDVQNSTNFAYG